MARRPHRAHPYTATSEVPTETGSQTTPWYGFGRASQEGRPDPRRSMPNRPVLIIVDYSPLQELTHQSVPDRALLTAMHPNNLRNTTATEHEALFTYARILEPNEVPAVQIQHLRPLMVIRLRTQWGIDFLASDLEFRYADLTGDVFQVPNTTTILDLLNEYRPDWRFRQYNYIHSTTLVPGTSTPFILRLQCHKVSQGVILP